MKCDSCVHLIKDNISIRCAKGNLKKENLVFINKCFFIIHCNDGERRNVK